jgi:hypothetical protein
MYLTISKNCYKYYRYLYITKISQMLYALNIYENRNLKIKWNQH